MRIGRLLAAGLVGVSVAARVAVAAEALPSYPDRYQAGYDGIEPWELAARDFDGDGALDVAVLHSKGVTLLESRGGALEPRELFRDDAPRDGTPSRPQLAAGDWNGDGAPDLAFVLGKGADTLERLIVLVHRPDGSFEAREESEADTILAVAAGDLDRDGADDLVVVTRAWAGTTGEVRALFGSRDGSFQEADIAPPAGMPRGAAVLRREGGTVVALTVEFFGRMPAFLVAPVLEGRQLGPWSEEALFSELGMELRAVDREGDGRDEIEILDAADGLYRGVVLGEIGPPARVTFHRDDEAISDAAFLPGVAVVAHRSRDAVQWLRLDDAGEVVEESVYSAGGLPQRIEPGDFDGDGTRDIAVALYGARWHDEPLWGGVEVVRRTPEGLGLPTNHAPTKGHLRSVELADLDGDGDLDALASVRSFEEGGPLGALVVLEREDGAWTERQRLDCADPPGEVAVGDVNGDGLPDAVAALSFEDVASEGSIHLYLGKGLLELSEARSLEVGESPVAARIDDANGDGKPDILVAVHGCHCYPGNAAFLAVLLGHGDGTFEEARRTPVGQYARCLELFDVDGDGRRDAIVAGLPTETEPGLLVLRSLGDGSFEPGQNVEIPTPSSLVLADIDADGREEIVAAGGGIWRCEIGEEIGDATAISTEVSPCVAVGVGDVTGDGIPDILAARSDWDHPVNDSLLVFGGTGGGEFAETESILCGLGPRDLLVGEVDAGGPAVLVAAGSMYEHCSSFLVTLPVGAAIAPAFVRADANADEKVDLSDAVFILGHLFLGGAEPACLASADADDGGSIEITDAVYLLNHLFLGGPEPPAPYPECGPDGTPDDLGCTASTCGR